MIEVKASVKHGDRLKSYNIWNKEMPIAVKGVGSSKDSFQLPPMVRAMIPTGITLEIPENTIGKIYIDSTVALKKGLNLISGVQLITDTSEVFLYVTNKTESLVTITNGDVLAYILLDPIHTDSESGE